MGVKGVCAALVGVHKVVKLSFPQGFAFVAERDDAPVRVVECLLLVGQFLRPCGQLLQGTHAPVVEDGRAAVCSAESLAVHARFAEFLSEVDHERIGVHESAHE